jgi:hypothetical protein
MHGQQVQGGEQVDNATNLSVGVLLANTIWSVVVLTVVVETWVSAILHIVILIRILGFLIIHSRGAPAGARRGSSECGSDWR